MLNWVDVQDLTERVLFTFGETFFAVISTAGLNWVSVGTWKAAAVAGAAAVFALAKNLFQQKATTPTAV